MIDRIKIKKTHSFTGKTSKRIPIACRRGSFLLVLNALSAYSKKSNLLKRWNLKSEKPNNKQSNSVFPRRLILEKGTNVMYHVVDNTNLDVRSSVLCFVCVLYIYSFVPSSVVWWLWPGLGNHALCIFALLHADMHLYNCLWEVDRFKGVLNSKIGSKLISFIDFALRFIFFIYSKFFSHFFTNLDAKINR
jgi:hypothetical protein